MGKHFNPETASVMRSKYVADPISAGLELVVSHAGDGQVRSFIRVRRGMGMGKPLHPAQLMDLARSRQRARQTHPGKRGRR